jgi:hypothetical protein
MQEVEVVVLVQGDAHVLAAKSFHEGHYVFHEVVDVVLEDIGCAGPVDL